MTAYLIDDKDPTLLIGYLRSDQPLDRARREWFAEYLELIMTTPLPTGRPRNENEWHFAEEVEKFYREWKGRNKHEGFPDHGLAENMKYLAYHYVAEIDGPEWQRDGDCLPSVEATMQMLSRSKNRRK